MLTSMNLINKKIPLSGSAIGKTANRGNGELIWQYDRQLSQSPDNGYRCGAGNAWPSLL